MYIYVWMTPPWSAHAPTWFALVSPVSSPWFPAGFPFGPDGITVIGP